jgi:hypothetical protein
MKRAGTWLVFCGAALGLVIVVRAIWAGKRAGNMRDVVDYVVFGWDERTRYAAGFSEQGFGRIQVGMEATEVVGRIGLPLREFRDSTHNKRVYYYSMPQDREGSYWARYVVLDSTGRVTARFRGFESD